MEGASKTGADIGTMDLGEQCEAGTADGATVSGSQMLSEMRHRLAEAEQQLECQANAHVVALDEMLLQQQRTEGRLLFMTERMEHLYVENLRLHSQCAQQSAVIRGQAKDITSLKQQLQESSKQLSRLQIEHRWSRDAHLEHAIMLKEHMRQVRNEKLQVIEILETQESTMERGLDEADRLHMAQIHAHRMESEKHHQTIKRLQSQCGNLEARLQEALQQAAALRADRHNGERQTAAAEATGWWPRIKQLLRGRKQHFRVVVQDSSTDDKQTMHNQAVIEMNSC